MQIDALTPFSITVSLDNQDIYYTSKFVVYLNDELIREENRICFSLFDLKPNQEYELKIMPNDEVLIFKTPKIVVYKLSSFLNKNRNDDTRDFCSAISSLPKNAALYVESGVYNLKPLFLKSNMILYLQKGANLIFDTNRDNYPILPSHKLKKGPLGTWQGDKDEVYASPLNLLNVENVSIIGEGQIDGNAINSDWYLNHRIKRGAWRPFGIFINNSKNILLQGIKVINSASWNIHPYFSKKLKFLDMTLINPSSMPTTDGIDIDSCQDVEIRGVNISCGDDCIALKSGTYEFVKEFGLHPTKNVLITSCLLKEGHGAVVFGSESSSGISDVAVKQCRFENTDRGFRLKTRRFRGKSEISNVSFDNIKMINVKYPFTINMFYNMGPSGGHEEKVWSEDIAPFTKLTPVVNEFNFSNIECLGVAIGATLNGLPESPIHKVSFKNCTFEFSETIDYSLKPIMTEKEIIKTYPGFYLKNVEQVKLEKTSFVNFKRDDVILKCGNTKIDGNIYLADKEERQC